MDELYGNDYEANDKDEDGENAQADNDSKSSSTPAGFSSPNRHKESLLSS